MRKAEPAADVKIPAVEKKKNYGMPIAVAIAGAVLAVGIYYLYSHMTEQDSVNRSDRKM